MCFSLTGEIQCIRYTVLKRFATFEVLKEMKIHVEVSWFVMWQDTNVSEGLAATIFTVLCDVRYQRFREPCCLHLCSCTD